MVVRERGGSTLPAVFKSEAAAQGWIASRLAEGTCMADEAGSWNDLHSRFQVERSTTSTPILLAGGIYTNGARPSSPASGAARSGITITSRGRNWSSTRRKAVGVRTGGRWIMAGR